MSDTQRVRMAAETIDKFDCNISVNDNKVFGVVKKDHNLLSNTNAYIASYLLNCL